MCVAHYRPGVRSADVGPKQGAQGSYLDAVLVFWLRICLRSRCARAHPIRRIAAGLGSSAPWPKEELNHRNIAELRAFSDPGTRSSVWNWPPRVGASPLRDRCPRFARLRQILARSQATCARFRQIGRSTPCSSLAEVGPMAQPWSSAGMLLSTLPFSWRSAALIWVARRVDLADVPPSHPLARMAGALAHR